MKKVCNLKRIVIGIIVLLLVVNLFPISAYKARAAAMAFDLWVGKTQVTTSNMSHIDCYNGYVSFDADTNTLTFHDVKYIIEGNNKCSSGECLIYTGIPLKIRGKATLNGYNSGVSIIFAEKADLDIQGEFTFTNGRFGIYDNSGKITISGNNTKISMQDPQYGIMGRFADVTIDGGTLDIDAEEYAIKPESCKLVINGGNINAKGNKSAIATDSNRLTISKEMTISNPVNGKIGSAKIDGRSLTTIVDDKENIAKSVEIKKAVNYNQGTRTIDLTSGKNLIGLYALEYLLGSFHALDYGRIKVADDEIDLDNDGSFDISIPNDMKFTAYALSSSNLLKKTYTLTLNDSEIKKAQANGKPFYEKIIFKFSNITAEPGEEEYNIGETTIDLSKGAYTLSGLEEISPFYNFYLGCVVDDSVKVNEKSLTDIDVDLDKDGTFDINILLTLTSKGKFQDMTISALPSASIKGSKAIELSEAVRLENEMVKNNYYSKVTFIFSNAETPVREEEGKKVEDPAAAPTTTEHKVGDVIADGGASYTITSVDEGKQSVTYTKPASNKVTSASIPAVITIDGKEFKVTEIAGGAFKGNKKLKKVTIGKNIVKIGAKAFFKCKSLKTVNVKTTFLTKSSVGGSAFKGIHEKAKVKVPKKKLKDYQKLFKAKGVNGKSQKITK